MKQIKDKLKDANDWLEKRVNERTRDLVDTNTKLIAAIRQATEKEEIIRRMAFEDSLTGLPNLNAFIDELKQAIADSSQDRKLMAVIFLNLDDFKRINDTAGRAEGDNVICEVARRLKANLRKGDKLAKIESDRFLILAQNLENKEAATAIVDKAMEVFADQFVVKNHEFAVTCSIGCAIYPFDGTNDEELIANAEEALRIAKESGKNGAVYCTETMKKAMLESLIITEKMYRAIDRKEMELYYQPQIDIMSGEIIGLEALLRWTHPELGTVSPKKSIPIAEKSGLIFPIGEWILNSVCKQNKQWKMQGLKTVPIAVNFSVRQFDDKNLVENVRKILEENGTAAEDIEVEITENIAVKEMEKVISTMRGFKNLGTSIAIDDFGTDYSSLKYLRHMPADKIKIDKSFIDGIGIDKRDEEIIKAVISLTKKLGMKVISEGVETKEQLDFLKMHGCQSIQGFYFYKPMPADMVGALLKENRC